MPTPELLEPNQPVRFYRGGPQLAEFRRRQATRDDVPEDWVGSSTCVYGSESLGLTALPDGRLLRDAIAAEPEAFLGPDHVAKFGADPALLVKLLDAGERLPVHCHPDGDFSRRHLGSRYGKTEAWAIIGTGAEGGVVYLGFADRVPREELRRWVAEQDTDELLAAMNELAVRPGEVWLVPAGIPHAIGEGLLIVELQEPTDLSVLLEWRGFPIDGNTDGHLGLGFDTALDAVDRSPWPRARLDTLRGRRGSSGSLLPASARWYFGLESIRSSGAARSEAGFAVVVATLGSGTLEFADSELRLTAGDTALLPYSAGPWAARGDLELLVCRPPTVSIR